MQAPAGAFLTDSAIRSWRARHLPTRPARGLPRRANPATVVKRQDGRAVPITYSSPAIVVVEAPVEARRQSSS